MVDQLTSVYIFQQFALVLNGILQGKPKSCFYKLNVHSGEFDCSGFQVNALSTRTCLFV